ncbi:uncharacterized protein N7473_006772 [Penicillium subrubescens]|uniref:uncharacterized protein n=1 Tax=Penicillium subrubescens TaxID=1316194 RepID=UPI00254539BA|nr:uncharacterized protein N7473_006772 [Penicillium subrubescens]KAJ5890544.1 hypothetical protein N7473_006772 [Penicillium subrubescens]
MSDDKPFALSDNTLHMSNDGETAKKRQRSPGTWLDLTQEDDEIRATLACSTSTVGASPATIMTTRPPTENALDDTAVDALSVIQPRVANNVYKWDFETNGMVRKVRKPSGLAVAVEAYGIRWISLILAPTLPPTVNQ